MKENEEESKQRLRESTIMRHMGAVQEDFKNVLTFFLFSEFMKDHNYEYKKETIDAIIARFIEGQREEVQLHRKNLASIPQESKIAMKVASMEESYKLYDEAINRMEKLLTEKLYQMCSITPIQ